MPMFETYLAQLNRHFGADRIRTLAAERRDHFAPGAPLDLSFLIEGDTPLQRAWNRHLASAPGSFREVLRGVVYYALSTEPPTPVTFAWAPGYDFEVTLWQAADTSMTRGGITVLLKSRYPDDRHPQQGGAKEAVAAS
jgi:hypothetical protein